MVKSLAQPARPAKALALPAREKSRKREAPTVPAVPVVPVVPAAPAAPAAPTTPTVPTVPTVPAAPQTLTKKRRTSAELHTPPRRPRQPLSLQGYEEVEKSSGFMPSKENGGALSYVRTELSPVVIESLHLPKLEMKESRAASASKLSKEQFAKQQQDEIEILLSELSGCNCKGKCSSRKCPCRNYGRTCGAQCKCQHEKCINRVVESILL